ncbi:hypothetical protein OPT61_g4079 [Boeremia exigua]|uniref:Uncharacterized protein n=1 Tax=Boeremia exigua TaxID=749465 RepID=A0ACC2IFC8_9PLEO|nr:hypothetical protein OPT61_g4079 [Boeremia exigua]
MVLAARVFYAMFIWMAKYTVSEFLKRLTERFWKKGYEWGLRTIRIFLAVTFVAVLIATLAECQPFTHYWQVKPTPKPRCRQGFAQLITMGVADIITDVLLIAFPIPIIVHSSMPLKRKISLVGLFSLSAVLIVITGARVPLVIERRGLQQFRSMFASSEILAATIVSNAIVLGSFLRDRGLKKAKFKAPSTTDSMERRGSARTHTLQQWGSDEDLARSLGYRTKPELADKKTSVPRPAPVADLGLLAPTQQPGPFVNTNWQFPGSSTSSSTGKATEIRDPMPSPRASSGRRVSFFDVGGLLENGSHTSPSPTDSVITHDFAAQPRRGSRASNSLLPNGRAYPPPARRSSRLSQQSEDYEMSARPNNQLRDPGGLLSEDREIEMEQQIRASPSTHSNSSNSLALQHARSTSLHRSPTQTSTNVISLQDAGGIVTSRSYAPITRCSTHTSYDVPSLQDAAVEQLAVAPDKLLTEARTVELGSGELVTKMLDWARGVKALVPKLQHRPRSPFMSSSTDEEALPSLELGALANCNAAPTLEEIIQLTRQQLLVARENDSIIECGRAALSLIPTNPDLSAKLAYQKLHDVPYKEVRPCWRRLYTDAALWKVLNTTERRVEQAHTDGQWLDEVVKLLDMVLILTAAPAREELVELWFAALEKELSVCETEKTTESESKSAERPAKKLKLDITNSIPSEFPVTIAETPIRLRHHVPRCVSLSLSAFQKKLSSSATHTPLVIENSIVYWPALAERPWNSPKYLLDRTLGGRRLVPIETGRSYTDSGWGQKITTFKDFMSTYMLTDVALLEDKLQTGYLAQHDLFAQIPALRADISIPDFCYCYPAPNPLPHIKELPQLEDPLLNAWFGPKGTISPLHTDPYHNILAQVVGYKYVRLYAPDQTKWLFPRSVDESGVDMSNTSLVDLDEAMQLFPEIGLGDGHEAVPDLQKEVDKEETLSRRQEFEEHFPGFVVANYVEGILGPGDCLYLPPGGNNGIGFDTVSAITAASPTYHVVIGSRSPSKGATALERIQAKSHPGSASLIQLDVTDDSSISAAAATIERDYGRLDILINNAGICPEPGDNAWPSRDEMRAIFETNVFGPTIVTKVMLPRLRKSKDPRIINVTSSLGSIATRLDPTDIVAGANYPAYRMSKAGLNMLTGYTCSLEEAKGVKVWSFCPGYVVTDLGGDRELKTSMGVDSSETSANGILEIVQGKRDGEAGMFVEREGRSRAW